MIFHVMTLFPQMIENVCQESILGRAQNDESITVHAVNIRDFSHDKHLHVDDAPFGGGAGMVMQAPPIFEAYESIMKTSKAKRVILMSPRGKTFSQKMAEELAQEEELIFLCGHYEGIDQRVIDEIVTDEVSIGDYVLTGGELPALVMIDTISRLVPGVLGNETSAQDESFSGMYLEYPQYTRPREYHGKMVPEVLLGGNHEEIRKWRLKEAMKITMERRPDLLDESQMNKEEKRFLAELKKGCNHE